MKLLAVEAVQNGAYYRSRYEQVRALGADVHVLNGLGTDDFWDPARYRLAGTADIDALAAAAAAWHDQAGFDGVLTFSESAVLTVAHLAERLALPGIGVQAALASRNKLLMRQAHARAGAAHPSFRWCVDVGAALAAGEELGYPAVLKPTLGAASNFVFRVDSPADMRSRFAQATAGMDGMSWLRMEATGVDLGPVGIIVESYLDGEEYLIEAVAWDDEVYLGSIVDRVAVAGSTFDDDVHHAPSALSAQQVSEVHAVVRDGAWAQGLWRSVMHAEVRMHAGRPHLVEIAVRPGGGGLDHMARLSAGYNPIAALRDVAAGVRPTVAHYRPTAVHTAAMCLLCPPGVIGEVQVPDDVRNHDSVFFIKITASPGDLIRRPPDGNSILGFLGARGTSFDDAMTVATGLASRITTTFADHPAPEPATSGSGAG